MPSAYIGSKGRRVALERLAQKPCEVANLIGYWDETVVDDRGRIVLQKVGRLIGTVEAAMDKTAPRAVLY